MQRALRAIFESRSGAPGVTFVPAPQTTARKRSAFSLMPAEGGKGQGGIARWRGVGGIHDDLAKRYLSLSYEDLSPDFKPKRLTLSDNRSSNPKNMPGIPTGASKKVYPCNIITVLKYELFAVKNL